jgi:hypothetical protein
MSEQPTAWNIEGKFVCDKCVILVETYEWEDDNYVLKIKRT